MSRFKLRPIAFAAAPGPGLKAMVQEKKGQSVNYTCPMDPDVRNATPGKCPKCGMDLRVAEPESQAAESRAKEMPAAAGPGQSVQVSDTAVYDQDGRSVHFYSDLVKGKTVAINFIFTTCTTICPPMTATFRRVQQILGERGGQDIPLISVSVDPTGDTPERMKSFAEKFHAEAGWTFVTGDKSSVDHLLRALGALVADKNDHTPLILVGNDPIRPSPFPYPLVRYIATPCLTRLQQTRSFTTIVSFETSPAPESVFPSSIRAGARTAAFSCGRPTRAPGGWRSPMPVAVF